MEQKKRYICLKQNSTSASAAPLVKKESTNGLSFNVLILVGALMVATLVYYTRSKKNEIEIEQLKSTVDFLKNENDSLLKKKKNVL